MMEYNLKSKAVWDWRKLWPKYGNSFIQNHFYFFYRFEWQIPVEDREFLSVDPLCGIVSPNELQVKVSASSYKFQEFAIGSIQ